MAGLSPRLALAALLAAVPSRPALAGAPAAAAAPPAAADALAKGALPGGGTARVRLVFKRGVQVEVRGLPAAFLGKDAPAQGWAGFNELSPEGRRWALGALFPADRWGQDQVLHQVRWPDLESVWLMAALFMGHGQHYDQLQAANPANPEKLRAGDLWVVPRTLLAEELGGTGAGRVARVQPEDGLDDEARMAAFRALLSFESDAQGAYAGYHLRKGEP